MNLKFKTRYVAKPWIMWVACSCQRLNVSCAIVSRLGLKIRKYNVMRAS